MSPTPDTLAETTDVTIGCTDPAILEKFHLKEFPAYDRALTKEELHHLLVLPEQEVPNSGMFSGKGKFDRETTLRLFQIWKRRGCVRPIRTSASLRKFLRTRAITVRDASFEELVDMCEQLLKDEANSGRAVRLHHTPYDDGKAEKQRRRALIDVKVLTSTNAPGLVPPSCPSLTDPKWQMLTRDVLEPIIFPDVLCEWLNLFASDFSSLMLKAQGAWSSGKAYAIKYQSIGEFLYVYARVGQSFSNATSRAYNVRVLMQHVLLH